MGGQEMTCDAAEGGDAAGATGVGSDPREKLPLNIGRQGTAEGRALLKREEICGAKGTAPSSGTTGGRPYHRGSKSRPGRSVRHGARGRCA